MPRTLRAQILLITLLVLMIISVIVVGVVGIANRDVRQTISEQQYQQILNASESQILDFVDRFGKDANAFATLPPGCTSLSSTVRECSLDFTDLDDTKAVIKIEETNRVNAFPLTKDESLVLSLFPSGASGYRGPVRFTYSGEPDVALEFMLVYSVMVAGVPEYRTVVDVFNPTGNNIFNPSLTNPLSASPDVHPFNFSVNAGGQYEFVISSIAGLPANYTTRSLRITARIPDNSIGSTALTLFGDASFPLQIREYTVTGFLSSVQDRNIVSNVFTQIPLHPQGPSFLYSGLLVAGSVEK